MLLKHAKPNVQYWMHPSFVLVDTKGVVRLRSEADIWETPSLEMHVGVQKTQDGFEISVNGWWPRPVEHQGYDIKEATKRGDYVEVTKVIPTLPYQDGKAKRD